MDTISVFLEDYEPRKGKITISCYDKSWHSYWGGMGNQTISEFFTSCDNHYLAKNLSSISSSVTDCDALRVKIKELTNDHYEDDDDTIELYEEIDALGDDREWDAWLQNNFKVMSEIFGEEWWYIIPTQINPEYKYLCKIIDTVKESLESINK